MKFYLNTENVEFAKLLKSHEDNFIGLTDPEVVTASKHPTDPNRILWNVDGKEYVLRKFMFDTAKKENKLICFDTTKTRLKKVKEIETETSNTADSIDFDPDSISITTTKLKDIEFDPRLFEPIVTGTYFDSFVSYKGGIMPGTNILVTGDPGVGKSSNLMDILVNAKESNPDVRVLYVSAEMDRIDVKEFTQYYAGLEDIDFLYLGDYVSDPDISVKAYQALMAVLHKGWDLVVLDSLAEVQGMCADDLGLTGKKAEKWLLDLLRKQNLGHNKANRYTSFLSIQQKTKGGTYVGSKRLEHMTTAFLNLGWSKTETGKRYMEFHKNRKGKEKVKLYYGFKKDGGIAYDSERHVSEMEILERASRTDSDELKFGQMNINEFEKMFSLAENDM